MPNQKDEKTGSKKTPAPKPLDWLSRTPDSWRISVDAWPWQSLGNDEWMKSGDCPRCGHPIEMVKQGLAITRYTTDLNEVRGSARSGSGDFPARCDCGEKHGSRPPGVKRGCGQHAFIDPPGKATK